MLVLHYIYQCPPRLSVVIRPSNRRATHLWKYTMSNNELVNHNSSLNRVSFTKKPLNFHQQINLLEARGMNFNDKHAAYFLLQHINYYRLQAYWFTYYETNEPDHRFPPGTSFCNILRDYYFDQKLRLHLLKGLECIEISFKAQFAYNLAHKYGAFPLQKENFNFSSNAWSERINKLKEECAASKEQFAEHMRNKYECEIFPIWALVEILSFGSIVTFYSYMKDISVMKEISKVYGLQPPVLRSWLQHLYDVRNICAHHARLWNRRFVKTPMEATAIRPDIQKRWLPAPSKKTDTSEHRNDRRIYNTFLIIDYLLSNIDSNNNSNKNWKPKLVSLIDEYKVDARRMGFPDSWRDDSFWASL